MKRLLLYVEETLLLQYEEKKDAKALNSFSLYAEGLSRKYELWIVSNAAFPESITAIRHSLKGILPQDRILAFHLPFQDKAEPYQVETNRLIEEYFMAQLHPDIILRMDQNSEKYTASPCRISLQRRKKAKFHTKEIGVSKSKPSLAYFSPMPPAKSGIASYSAELLPYLDKYYDITVILDLETVQLADADEPYKVLSVDEFKEQYETFDRILYHFGNSFYHGYMWPLLKAYPGVVVLHDFFLSGLLSYEELVNGRTCWTEQLFKSHGYKALQERFNPEKLEEAKFQYPCNFEVLQYATGIIVHSAYSQNLADKWYTVTPLKSWDIIPHLRIPVGKINKKNAREKLGFSENDLIICSFGILNLTKLNDSLLKAFLNSELANDINCYLIFVGENNSGEYAVELEKTISQSMKNKRIKITGWTNEETFKNYLEAADIGVQLRTESRGETSGTVLDCMNYGLATVVNANGSMASLPKDAVFMLDDNFNNDDLTEALERLGKDRNFAKNLGQKAKNYIQTHHNPRICAEKYMKTIEGNHAKYENYNTLISKLAQIELPSSSIAREVDKISKSISHSTLQKITQRQLFVDVSAIVQNDLRTGIERVVRAQLLKLIDLLPDTVRVEPVYLSEENGLHYRYARTFTTDILNIPLQINEERVSVNNGDIFYGLDFYRDGVIKAAQKGIYTQWAAEGVSINFAVYDLLPIRYPHFFPKDTSKPHHKWLETIVSVSDTLICISNAVADELKRWISSQMPQELERNIHIAAVHLGSDIVASAPTEELPDNAKEILGQISTNTTFLMVGTIEPRKGYLQTLAAFELLWQKNMDLHLVIVGSEGWKGLADSERKTIPEIINRLKNHPQSGKKLFWLDNVSDLFLETLYRQADALIAASEDEGFGLPLIEAAHYALPIMARDIPVFREVASDNAFYFSNSKEPLVLADAITLWLEEYQNNNHILSDAMSCITWKESAQKIIEVLSLTKEVNSEEEYYESKQMIETEKDQDRYRLPPRAEEIYLDLLQLKNQEREE